MRKIWIMVSILLLLIGNVNAENNTVSNDTSNTSIDYTDVESMINEDIGSSKETENVVIENGDITPMEKKSSPGFELTIVIIMFLFVIIGRRR